MKSKDVPSWVLSPTLLATRILPNFFPRSVLPMDGHLSCVLMGPWGHRCYPDVSVGDFEVP